MSYTVLARKWRPKNFAELVGQQHVMQALSNALEQQRLHHAYLFTGTRGVGKTTIARIFAKALNCEQGITSKPCGSCSVCTSVDEGRFVDLIEVDAASKTKVDDTREMLENVQYAPVQGRFKVYLIDEVHMLSKSSFNALLKTLEEPPENVKFLLATTDPHKLPVTVLSRCLQFNLMRLTQEQIRGHLAFILEQEKIKFEDTALALIAKAADGSARDSLSILDQSIAFGAGEVGGDAVKAMLGLVDQQYTVDIVHALINSSADEVLEVIKKLSQIGVDYVALNNQLSEVFHQIMMIQVLGSLSEVGTVDEQLLQQAASAFSADRVQALYQIGLLAKQDMKLAPDVRIAFEMSLLRMLAFEVGAGVSSAEKKKLTETQAPQVSSNKNNKVNSSKQVNKTSQITENLTDFTPPPSKKQGAVDFAIKNTVDHFDFLDGLKGRINQTLSASKETAKKESTKEITVKVAEKLELETERFAEPIETISATGHISEPKPKPEVEIEVGKDGWQQIIEKLELKGMEADLANSSILIEQIADSIVLSIDPDKVKVMDLAIKKLKQIVKEKMGYDLSFVVSEQQHLTPNKVRLNKKEEQREAAKQSIYADRQVQDFVEILNMEVIDTSIRTK